MRMLVQADGGGGKADTKMAKVSTHSKELTFAAGCDCQSTHACIE